MGAAASLSRNAAFWYTKHFLIQKLFWNSFLLEVKQKPFQKQKTSSPATHTRTFL